MIMGKYILLIVLFAYYRRRESIVTGSLRLKRFENPNSAEGWDPQMQSGTMSG